jgi:hypothetical protein
MLPGLNFAVIELYLPKCGRPRTACQTGCTGPSTFRKVQFSNSAISLYNICNGFHILSVFVFISIGKRKENYRCSLRRGMVYFQTLLLNSILLPSPLDVSPSQIHEHPERWEMCTHVYMWSNPSTNNPIMGDCLHNARKASKDLGQVYNNYAFLSNNLHNPKYIWVYCNTR